MYRVVTSADKEKALHFIGPEEVMERVAERSLSLQPPLPEADDEEGMRKWFETNLINDYVGLQREVDGTPTSDPVTGVSLTAVEGRMREVASELAENHGVDIGEIMAEREAYPERAEVDDSIASVQRLIIDLEEKIAEMEARENLSWEDDEQLGYDRVTIKSYNEWLEHLNGQKADMEGEEYEKEYRKRVARAKSAAEIGAFARDALERMRAREKERQLE